MTIKLDASTLISSLPAMLGYQVHDSIVAVMLKRHGADLEAVECVLRADLDNSVDDIATMAAKTGRTARNTAAAVLIAVAGPQHHGHAGDALDALRNALMDADIPVRGRFSVATTAAPAIWMDVDTGQRGITAPWTDSPVTAEAVVAGKVIANSRDDLPGVATYVDRGAALITPEAITALQRLRKPLHKKIDALEAGHLQHRLELLATYFDEAVVDGHKGTPAHCDVTFALLYFLKGFDRIPDSVPEVGLLDDAMIVQVVLQRNSTAFRAHWLRRRRSWPQEL
jgi:uncharacterized membrane protein YkvA (DUF1232 family)